MLSCAMLGRVADAQNMLSRWLEAGGDVTITQRWTSWQRQEDVELLIEAFRIAGVAE